MARLLLVVAAVAAWIVRRSIGRSVERASLRALPPGPDGVIEGAGSIELPGAGRRAVLILHGFGDTPQTLGYLAEHLNGLGFAVRAPLLAGHGRTLREFAESGADQWLDSAARELVALQRQYEAVGVVGVSMGGALAVILAAEGENGAQDSRHRSSQRTVPGPVPDAPHPGDARPPAALVLIAPYLSMRTPARRLAAWHRVLWPFISYLPSREEASIVDAAERRRNRGFGTVTPRLLHELQRLVSRARASLSGVMIPTLVIQSRTDNRIDPDAATRSFDGLGCAVKRFEWTEGGGHVITVDVGRERVLELAGDWLLARVGGSPADGTPAT